MCSCSRFCLSSCPLSRGFGTLAGLIMTSLTWERRRYTRWFSVFSNHAPHTIVQPVASLPPPRQLENQRLSLCALGAKSKAGGERRNGSTPRAWPVPTESVRPSESQTLTFMRLFGDGKHGQAERIQRFRGPACRTTFTARRHTPFSRLKTPSHQVAMVLTARACGLDPSEAPRIFGYRQATIVQYLLY
jgi:hypothetical protein